MDQEKVSILLVDDEPVALVALEAILGFAQLLRRDQALTEQQRQRIDTIIRSGEHLLALITDILAYSKIEAGRLSVEEATFDLHAMLGDLEVMFRMRAEGKGLRMFMEHCERTRHHVVTDETNRLRRATLRAGIDTIVELCGQAEAHSPEVAQQIRKLAARFDYTSVLALLDGGKEA